MMVNETRCLNRFACIELDKTIVTNAALATVILFLVTGHFICLPSFILFSQYDYSPIQHTMNVMHLPLVALGNCPCLFRLELIDIQWFVQSFHILNLYTFLLSLNQFQSIDPLVCPSISIELL